MWTQILAMCCLPGAGGEMTARRGSFGLTHFVDDRPEVDEALRGVVEHQYLFGPQEEPAPDDTIPVQRWPEARRLIEATLDSGG
jgi:hypothetical protein